jgi:hypothetical protein
MGTMLKRNDCDTKACLLMYIRLRHFNIIPWGILLYEPMQNGDRTSVFFGNINKTASTD